MEKNGTVISELSFTKIRNCYCSIRDHLAALLKENLLGSDSKLVKMADKTKKDIMGKFLVATLDFPRKGVGVYILNINISRELSDLLSSIFCKNITI